MKQIFTILKAALNLFTLQIMVFLNKTETGDIQSLPSRWALVPVKNNNRLIKNK